MRLLKYKENREPEIISFDDDTEPPPYAILSHTWGGDADEVTFIDIVSGNGTAKHGYNKIRFCGDQAQQDGLQYFWVDTCCIDKTDRAELSHAIQSMFFWYQNATKCYVYLSDVSTRKRKFVDTQHIECTWEPAFRSSRWFTRGWTLQELLAPSVVEFFSQEWDRLGDKTSLGSLIRRITGISQDVLNGLPLSQSTINERLRWTEGRETKQEEDRVYSLLGIFDVELAPMYGEGAAAAFKRLMNEIDNLKRCVQDLHSTNPRDDKERIEEIKGGLLVDSYRWVLSNITFQQWRQRGRMLWVRGDPGKGKTMLLCGIIDELHKLLQHTALIAYFFCQATDSRINSATAVLRGLLYMLVTQQPILALHVRKRYDQAGENLFEDANAWVALREIFVNVLKDPRLKPVYLIIDALDECVTDMPKLLDLIVKLSPGSSRVKWIVSSRNWPEIEQLEQAGQNVQLSLELNAKSVATGVSIFIQHKVSQLAKQKNYDKQTYDIVVNHLTSNSNDTYLWVGLVCQELQTTARRNVWKKLDSFPPGLNALYEQMMHQISKTDDAELCKHVLASLALVYRPVTLDELIALVKQLEGITDVSELQDIIGHCGSFLALRQQTVYFVHQSAKDFILAKAAEEVFLKGKEYVMHSLLVRSLHIMTTTLGRDMYGLGALGYTLDDHIEAPNPDPLASSRYSCIYWIDHLYDLSLTGSTTYAESLQDGGIIESFLQSRFLYWLEALSLCKSMSKGVVSIGKLQKMVQIRGAATPFAKLVYDIHRFVMYHKQAIERSPLQAYASALLFSPKQSLTRKLFQHEKPTGITVEPPMSDDWSACLQTLEGHSDVVYSVTFSRDSTRLASASEDGTAKIWDANSGACQQTLDVDSEFPWSVAFSLDMTRMASSSDKDVKIWDTSNGACLQTLTSHDNDVASIAFSHDSKWVALASWGDTIEIWDMSSGTCLQTLTSHAHAYSESTIAFSYDSTRLVTSGGRYLMIWNTSNGTCLRTLTGHDYDVVSVAFSHDSKWVASASRGDTVKIWDVNSGTCIQTLDGYSGNITSVIFSNDSNCLASASDDGTVKIWDGDSGACLYTLEGHSGQVSSITFSYDSNWLASASHDNTIKVWDLGSGASSTTSKGHRHKVKSITFSHDLTQLASASSHKTIKIWDTSSGSCVRTLEDHDNEVILVVFSHNSARLASMSIDGIVKIWDVGSSMCIQTIRGSDSWARLIVFSPDSTRLASASLRYGTVQIWDISSGDCLRELLFDDSYSPRTGAFSHDLNKLASTFKTYMWPHQTPSNSLAAGSLLSQRELNYSIKIWDLGNGTCLQTMESQNKSVRSITFSHDSSQLAAAFDENIVKIFDTNSGVCLQTLSVDQRITSLSFDSTGSYIHTDVGTIAVDSSETSNLVDLAEPKPCQWLGAGISSDGMWITNDDQNILRIPPEYRADCSCVGEDMVAIGTGSGKVWICSVDLPSALICR